MMISRKSMLAVTAMAGIVATSLSLTSSAEARWAGHRGGGFGIGAGVATGLALGAAAGGYYGGYGYRGYGYPGYGYGAYAYDSGYGGCEIQRRVRYTPYGPVVRHVRVCY